MEVILVDDGSVDDTAAAVLQAYPAVRMVENPQPSGFTVSANRGLAAAEGQIVLLLNSDTEVGEGALAALLEAFEDQRLGVAGAQLSYPDGRDQWSGGPEPGLMWLFLQSSGWAALLARRILVRRIRRALGTGARQVDWVTGAALAVRRPALTEVGPLDERFSFYAQDLDLCLRAKDAGWSVRIVPDFRIVHRHGYSIARLEETVAGQQLETLWRDLLRWAEKRRGPAWERRAFQALLWGGRFRVLGRVLVSPIMRPLKGLAWRRNTAACRQALAALEHGGSLGRVDS
jgi:GT2 family glycosyltransferase